MKNDIKVWMLVLAGWGMTGCIEHTPKVKVNPKPVMTKGESAFIEKKDYKGFRMYAGSVPCEDCDRIEQRLVLKGDTLGIFRLTETYRNATPDGDAVLVCTGEWAANKIGNELHLSVGHLGDSVRTMDYHLLNKELIQWRADGETITTTGQYHLKLIKSAK